MQFWQEFEPPAPKPAAWTESYAAPMPDGTRLRLPLRDLGDFAVAGMIANQASFAVVDRLVGWMAAQARAFAPEIVVALPTLGHVYGPPLARALGHPNWAAPGTSRKLWYEEQLSVPLSSITSPTPRTLWLDPRLLPRLAGRRVLLVDDVISTGSSMAAGIALLDKAGIRPVAALAAMLQGDRWQGRLGNVPVAAAFSTPIFHRVTGGWRESPFAKTR